ncbi:DUF6053 domain-containing protein [Lysobacter enzymogenes]|uniref:DUF6053 domain-containing protein n=1 Tax=Lysobacter enzymogenes TaxID=69 RepID=UPI003D18BAEC
MGRCCGRDFSPDAFRSGAAEPDPSGNKSIGTEVPPTTAALPQKRFHPRGVPHKKELAPQKKVPLPQGLALPPRRARPHRRSMPAPAGAAYTPPSRLARTGLR